MKTILWQLAAAGLLGAAELRAAVPSSFTYQGNLYEKGAPVNGSKSVSFRITDSAGAAAYWNSGPMTVSVSSGHFKAELSPSGVAWDSVAPYLEVSVEGSVLTPREPLNSVPYALAAGGFAGSALTVSGGAFSVGGSTLAVSAGKVGIGTTSPTQKLEVAGKVLASGAVASFELAPRDGTGTTFQFYNPTGDDWRIYGNGGPGDLVTFTNAGNVGIGTTGPGGNLHIEAAATTKILASNTASAVGSEVGRVFMHSRGVSNNWAAGMAATIPSTAPGVDQVELAFYTSPPAWTATERMRISGSGDVGIGTTSPLAPLHVKGATSGSQLRIGQDVTNDYLIGRDGPSGFLSFNGLQTGWSGYMFKVNNGVDVMRIINNGNVGIGTVAPNGKLEVQGGPIRASGGLILPTFNSLDTATPRPTAIGAIWLEQ